MNRDQLLGLLLFCWFVFTSETGFAQISSDADAVVLTGYSSGSQDNIHIFCGDKNELNASLTASLVAAETGTFEWQKYNNQTGTFDFLTSDLSGTNSSTIMNLENGGYRVTITATSGVKIFTAWVFNNYMETSAEIPASDCTSFTLKGAFSSPEFNYTDLTNGQPISLAKGIQVKWLEENSVVSRVMTSEIFNPPTKNTNYTFEATDKFGCMSSSEILYNSIVTKALFSASENSGEAPLEVTFSSQSENGDPGQFEWFIFRDINEINEEAAKNPGAVIDSLLVAPFKNDNPVFTFENTGSYMVKMVSKKVSEFNTCYDTVYLGAYITVDTSFVDAPNVFTPNGDGYNDEFVVKFWSMKEIKISIFNRWGKSLHVYENNNVQGFSDTYIESVWDGKVGGKLATPGVYYYVVEGLGRDGKRRTANGFFHLFRGN